MCIFVDIFLFCQHSKTFKTGLNIHKTNQVTNSRPSNFDQRLSFLFAFDKKKNLDDGWTPRIMNLTCVCIYIYGSYVCISLLYYYSSF